jgi:hypothetical protein
MSTFDQSPSPSSPEEGVGSPTPLPRIDVTLKLPLWPHSPEEHWEPGHPDASEIAVELGPKIWEGLTPDVWQKVHRLLQQLIQTDPTDEASIHSLVSQIMIAKSYDEEGECAGFTLQLLPDRHSSGEVAIGSPASAVEYALPFQHCRHVRAQSDARARQCIDEEIERMFHGDWPRLADTVAKEGYACISFGIRTGQGQYFDMSRLTCLFGATLERTEAAARASGLSVWGPVIGDGTNLVFILRPLADEEKWVDVGVISLAPPKHVRERQDRNHSDRTGYGSQSGEGTGRDHGTTKIEPP